MEYFDKTVSADCDCHGVEPMGVDKDGFWFGTANCWLVLNDEEDDGPGTFPATPHFIQVNALLGKDDFAGYVVASSKERALNYFEGIGCTAVEILYCDKIKIAEGLEKDPWAIYVTDEEREAIKESK